jgi:cytochrome c-type biogenesis protein CcmH/NrfF
VRRLLTAALVLLALAVPAAAPAATARTSLPVIERQVMCTTCKIPLNVAQSPQADSERAFIQGLIDKGYGEARIKKALVGQYGQAVLALPADHGFGAAAYLVPLAAVIILAGLLVTLLPRWRRAARRSAGPSPASAPLPPEDAARLEADLARFD